MSHSSTENNQSTCKQEDDDRDFVDDVIRSAQDGVLFGARRIQRTYRSIIRGEILEKKVDSHALAFGAGVGAGLGLGASFLLRLSPIGRVTSVVAGAAGGALASFLTSGDDDAPENEEETPRSNEGRPVDHKEATI